MSFAVPPRLSLPNTTVITACDSHLKISLYISLYLVFYMLLNLLNLNPWPRLWPIYYLWAQHSLHTFRTFWGLRHFLSLRSCLDSKLENQGTFLGDTPSFHWWWQIRCIDEGYSCNGSLQMLQEAGKMQDIWHCSKDQLVLVSYLDLFYVQI